MEKIGNVRMDYRFYNGSDDYSDGDIENELLQYVKENDDVMEILKKENRWPILYHLSPVRQNILDWYDFTEDASALEIGAGCGAVTGALCRKCKNVTGVELSKRRALINAYRNKKYSNLNIIVGNFNDIDFNEKYDYITLIGVLEYAAYFTPGDNSYVRFLEKIKGLLKPNGKLLIAIENKYGMKYFAGSAEDHTGHLFDGIEGYIRTDSKVRTFSKGELKEIVKSAGFNNIEFYYPFPDYKFPVQVFSDLYLPKPEDVVCSLDVYDNNRIRLFDETAAFANAINAGMFDFFSNSFFMELSQDKIVTESGRRKIYAKITKDRRPKYRIETDIYYDDLENIKYVEKAAVGEAAVNHIHNMYEIYKNDDGKNNASLCKSSYKDGRIRFEYIKGRSLCDKLLDQIHRNSKSGFQSLIDVYKKIVNDFGFKRGNDKDEMATGLNIDLTFDNIIEVSPNEYKVIDYEWCIERELPVKFVFYRAIFAFYMRYQDSISSLFSLKELLELFDISMEDEERFSIMNEEFIDYVYDSENGYNKVLKSYKKETKEFEDRSMSGENFAQLFIDTGEGIAEDQSIKIRIDNEKSYGEYVFDITGYNVKKLRFDPYNLPSVVKIKRIYAVMPDGSKKDCIVEESNASSVSICSYLFENVDPQMIISGAAGAVKLVVIMKITLSSLDNCKELLRLTDIRTSREHDIEKDIIRDIFVRLENHKNVLPDIEKYFSVTKKLLAIEDEMPANEKKLVTLSDTYREELSIFVDQMTNLAELKDEMEKQLKASYETNTKLIKELEDIKGTKTYKLLLRKKGNK